jgi:hypothetical protein
MENLKIRESCEEDMNFIYNSWLRSFRNSPLTEKMDNESYYYWQSQLITLILKDAKCYILEDSENNNILGYVVVDHIGKLPVIHYGYVKYPFRKMGFFTRLLKETVGEARWYLSHSTNNMDNFIRKFNCSYVPHICFKQLT